MKQFGFKQGRKDPRRTHAPARQTGRPVVIGQPSKNLTPREARNLMWRADPHCHWCGKLTRLPAPRVKGVKHRQEHDWATLDHLVSRLEPSKRQAHKTGERRWVLACFACNVRRSHEEMLRTPIEELWRRSGHYPLRERGAEPETQKEE